MARFGTGCSLRSFPTQSIPRCCSGQHSHCGWTQCPTLGCGTVPLRPLTSLSLTLLLSQHLGLPQLQLLICIILDASKGVLGWGTVGSALGGS